MRKLMYFTIGFVTACALYCYTESTGVRLACVAAILIFGALAGKDPRPVQRSLLVLIGCLGGMLWFSSFARVYVSPAAALDGMERNVEIRADDFGYETNYGTAFDGSILLNRKPYHVRVYLTDRKQITPGDYLYGDFRFRYTGPAGEQDATYHPGKGIFLLAYQTDTVTAVDYPPTRRDIPARIRNKAGRILAECFLEDTAGFAKALLLGDTRDISYETDTDFKVSGIRHVIAVSGLHVSILFTLFSVLTFRKRWLTAILGFPALLLFAAVAGFTPSVSRACLMSGLMLLGMLAGREYDGPTALSFAILMILLLNPLAVTSVSLQLSAASVAGIYLFSSPIRMWMIPFFGEVRTSGCRRMIANWIAGSVSITLGAMTLTTPLCAYYFGTVSLIGPVTNLLAMWVVSFIFYGIMGICGIYFLSVKAAAWLARIIALPIRYVLLVSKLAADVPMASVYTQSIYITVWLVLVYVLLIVFCFSANRKPVSLICCAILGLCTALLAGWTEPLLDNTRLTVLDVGQGQCLLVQTEGKTFLIDCGGDSETAAADLAAQTLLSQGINRLDGLILTHLDRDHAGGVGYLLSRIDTDFLILPPEVCDLDTYEKGEVVYATEPVQLSFGDSKIQIYPPTFPGNSNEMSLCILFDTKNCDILVTGDRTGFGERSLLRGADIPDVDILIAGHHGSKHSTCEELLTAAQPELVCISAGKDNSYGHPAPELLQRLREFGCTVCRTDQQGTIIIRR